jgi:hypothetical protein
MRHLTCTAAQAQSNRLDSGTVDTMTAVRRADLLTS